MNKVTQISTNSFNGGAGIAALRLHNEINKSNSYKSYFYTEFIKQKSLIENNIFENKFRTIFRKINSKLSKQFAKNIFLNENLESFSYSPFYFSKNLSNLSSSDIYHLHWFQHEFINLRDINKLPNNRIVWTLHDCWPIQGTEHYVLKKDQTNKIYLKLKMRIKNYKKNLIKNKNIHLVAPSKWMKEEALNSFENFTPNITVIPNAIPDIFFKELRKNKARKLLNLPLDKTLVLFSSLGGLKDKRKGIEIIIDLIKYLHNESSIEFITIGPFQEIIKINKEMIHYLGKINDLKKLFHIYKATDMVLVPSLIDNLPQVATEAQACGRPIVCMRNGGLKDIVINKKTGFFSKDRNPKNFTQQINNVIKNGLLNEAESKYISKRAKSLWSGKVIREAHINLYNDMLKFNHQK